MKEVIKNKIRKYREIAGISQQQLADEANISRRALVDLEAERSEPRSAKTALRIAKALGAKVGDIFQLVNVFVLVLVTSFVFGVNTEVCGQFTEITVFGAVRFVFDSWMFEYAYWI